MRKAYGFNFYSGRGGSIEGMFISTDEENEKIFGKTVDFGEVLGKHSEVIGPVERGDIYPIDLSESTVEELYRVIGKTISGYNPFDYIEDIEDTEE